MIMIVFSRVKKKIKNLSCIALVNFDLLFFCVSIAINTITVTITIINAITITVVVTVTITTNYHFNLVTFTSLTNCTHNSLAQQLCGTLQSPLLLHVHGLHDSRNHIHHESGLRDRLQGDLAWGGDGCGTKPCATVHGREFRLA